MNITDDGPLYPEERPFYYDPGIPKDTGTESRKDERKLTMLKVLIILILTLFLSILF